MLKSFSNRLLFITRNLPPLVGGMERLNQQAVSALSEQYDVTIFGPLGAAQYFSPSIQVHEVQLNPLWRYLLLAQWESLRLALRLRPDVVYSGSGLTAPMALLAASACGSRSVCYLHGLDIVVDHPLYRAVFLPAIRRIDKIIVNSRHTSHLAQSVGVAAERISVVNPGVDLPSCSQRSEAWSRFRDSQGLGGRPVLLAAGRLTQRKGLLEFITYSMPAIQAEIPDVCLIIIGAEATSALTHRIGIATCIQEKINDLNLASNVRLLGRVDDRMLSDAFFGTDLVVFPVLDLPGDVEGFGMVALEAAAHGVATVAFNVGGVSDSVADGVSGSLIPPGDYSGFSNKVISLLSLDAKIKNQLSVNSREHAASYEWGVFGRHLRMAVCNRS